MANFQSILSECERTIQYFDSELKALDTEMGVEYEFIVRAVDLCGEALKTLKKFVIEIGFENQKDEIYFFKNLKPHVSSKLHFYLTIYKIQTSLFVGNTEFQLELLRREQDSIKRFLQENITFYQYYRSRLAYLDKKYFIRGKSDLVLVVKNPLVFEDPVFSTSHDYLLSTVIANEMLLTYLEKEIHRISYDCLNKYDKNTREMDFGIGWSDTKVALVELLYALDSLGSINKGNIDIKELAEFFGRVLNVDLGDVYRVFSEIKLRKKDRTKFLDNLKEALIQRMDESDQR